MNPYKFGLVGSTDSHTALATADRKTTSSASTPATEPSPARMEHPGGLLRKPTSASSSRGSRWRPGWLRSGRTENTREAALRRHGA